jgi:predicted transcriptional regulator
MKINRLQKAHICTARTHESSKDYKCVEIVWRQMTSEFGELKEVIVTPEMLKRYFSMTKTEIVVHLFLLSVCDDDRHIKRNVRSLARETKRWHAEVYRAITGLKLLKMLEEKQLKTKGSKYWRVYPLPRTRKDKPNVKEAFNPDITVGELDNRTAITEPQGKKGFLSWALEKMIGGKRAKGRGGRNDDD